MGLRWTGRRRLEAGTAVQGIIGYKDLAELVGAIERDQAAPDLAGAGVPELHDGRTKLRSGRATVEHASGLVSLDTSLELAGASIHEHRPHRRLDRPVDDRSQHPAGSASNLYLTRVRPLPRSSKLPDSPDRLQVAFFLLPRKTRRPLVAEPHGKLIRLTLTSLSVRRALGGRPSASRSSATILSTPPCHSGAAITFSTTAQTSSSGASISTLGCHPDVPSRPSPTPLRERAAQTLTHP